MFNALHFPVCTKGDKITFNEFLHQFKLMVYNNFKETYNGFCFTIGGYETTNYPSEYVELKWVSKHNDVLEVVNHEINY